MNDEWRWGMGWGLSLCALLAIGCGDDGGRDGSPDGGGGGRGAVDSDFRFACQRDAECDDGDFCNGEERCVDSVCYAGEPVTCDDGVSCTVDRCDGELATCVSTPVDADGDGHGDSACLDADGVPLGDDCDDDDDDRFPGHTEVCDDTGHDEDCDLSTLGGRYGDEDDDGFIDDFCCNFQDDGALLCGADCNDRLAGVNPGTPEACNDIDDDCDGTVDEDVQVVWHADADGDGFGDPDAEVMVGCGARPDGHVLDDTDCDDDDNQINPGATELCDGKDSDCDGRLDAPNEDADGDGIVNAACCADELLCTCSGAERCDCDDDDAEVGAGLPGISVNSQAALDDFPIVRRVCGGIDLSSPDIDDLSRLAEVAWVGGRMIIDGTALTSLSALEALREVAGSLDVVNNPTLAALDMPALESVGSLVVVRNDALRSLSGLGALREVRGSLRVSDNVALEEIGPLGLDTALETFEVKGNPVLASFGELGTVETETIWLDNLPMLGSLAGLPPFSGVIELRRLPALSDLQGAVATSNELEWFEVTNCNGLTDLDGLVLQDATAVTVFNVSFNTMLSNLTGLESLGSHCCQPFRLAFNDNLTSLAALSNMTILDARSLEIHDNPALPQCQIDEFLLQTSADCMEPNDDCTSSNDAMSMQGCGG